VNTSSFSKSGNKSKAVSIAGKSPTSFKGRQYRKLAPLYWFFVKYKKDGDEIFYTEQYQKEVLDKLDPKKVYEELGEDAILCCWEGPRKFCHRHLVAKWFKEKLGIEITEI